MKFFHTSYTNLLSFCLVLLGFSSCKTSPPETIVCEYGVPSASYKISGTIIDKNTKTPIQNIAAVLRNDWRLDSVQTNSAGKFQLQQHDFPSDTTKFYLEFKDVDGRYESRKDTVVFTNPQFKNGDGNWYEGEAEIDLGNVELKPTTE